jgi:pimeloyl-ACP methyl ester carboxylesterase
MGRDHRTVKARWPPNDILASAIHGGTTGGMAEFVDIAGTRIEVVRRGRDSPLLFLCSEEALELEAPVLDELARDHELIIPSPPGFGRSDRPDWITNPDDIAYFYLELLDLLGLANIAVVGCSLGGFIAAEMATKDDAAIEKLVLVGAYGVKLGGPSEIDIADIWVLNPKKVAALKWFDTARSERDFKSMPEEALEIVARNNESFARFCWEPLLHDPKLKYRLHRIKVPTLLIWGANDGIVSPEYGRAYADLIPNARMTVIDKAGHYPHLEQPAEFLRHLRSFLVA